MVNLLQVLHFFLWFLTYYYRSIRVSHNTPKCTTLSHDLGVFGDTLRCIIYKNSISTISAHFQWNRWRTCYLLNKIDGVPVTGSPCGSRTVISGHHCLRYLPLVQTYIKNTHRKRLLTRYPWCTILENWKGHCCFLNERHPRWKRSRVQCIHWAYTAAGPV